MSDARLASAHALRRLNNKAITDGLNRSISDEAINSLDMIGSSIINQMMWHEHKAGELTQPHLRCQVLMKFTGDDQPHEAYLDVYPDDYNALPEAKRMVDE